MKNNYIWAVVALVVIIVGILLFSGKKNTSELTENATSTSKDTSKTPLSSVKPSATAPAPIVGMKTSLGGIFDEKGNYQCDYKSLGSSEQTSNTVYVSNGKMRGEFRTYQTGASTGNIVVYDGDYLYVWTEGQSTGKISQPKTLADLPGIIPEDVSSGRILGTSANNVSWNCHAWSRDASKLVRPSYVTFN